MSRKRKKKKNSSYRETSFKKGGGADKLGHLFVATDSRLTKETIVKYTNPTLFRQMLNNEEIVEHDKIKGVYMPTNKFTKAFNKENGTHIFGGSSATIDHYKGVETLASLIPKEVLQRGNYKNGTVLSMENKMNRKKDWYRKKVNNYIKEISEQKKELISNYKTKMKDTTISNIDKVKIKSKYQDDLKLIDLRLKTLNKHEISPADIHLKLHKDEAHRYADNIREYSKEIEEIDSTLSKRYLELSERIETRTRTTTSEVIELSLEVLTGAYRVRDVVAKENYAYINDTEIEFIKYTSK